MSDQQKNDDDKWRTKLTPEEFRICREKGTEPAFSGKYWEHKAEGKFNCKCCGEPLFSSSQKYDSGCGWPSFFAPLEKSVVRETLDRTHGMVRTEVTCERCGCHLGHVFTDGPQPTGLRYCVNSTSVSFREGDSEA
ncbi:peptide-methionine (R)-S-oxide reductase MsrB [Teredinibacter franksiae]|uniref:peptide-methionine (R)-S-oxide reductase MsrB n=1 Tax=Teredinibacter franksiae TaxID=2761453 RepID=UPI001626C7E3|nr:peptide-methionine (R)-S-oxide reductase MsrB [Teredinibacter franksiae]